MTALAGIEAARARLAEWHRSTPRAANLPLGHVNWTYDGDKHVEAVDRLPVIIMGFNAGAGNGATATRLSGSELRWRTRCTKLAAGFGDGENKGRFVLAELILLGSFDKASLRAQYGDLESAFTAGADVNRAVIAYHQPKIIFQTGIDERDSTAIAPLYRLKYVRSRPRPAHRTHTLLKHYEMVDGTPWLAVMHFARVGFSNLDLEAIRDYAVELVPL